MLLTVLHTLALSSTICLSMRVAESITHLEQTLELFGNNVQIAISRINNYAE
jgi:hypothetical protein